MWGVLEKDGRCEVGTGQGPFKSDVDDNILSIRLTLGVQVMKLIRTPYLLTHATSPFLLNP